MAMGSIDTECGFLNDLLVSVYIIGFTPSLNLSLWTDTNSMLIPIPKVFSVMLTSFGYCSQAKDLTGSDISTSWLSLVETEGFE